VRLKFIRLLSNLSKGSNELVGRCLNIRGDIQSMPEATRIHEQMEVLSSLRDNGKLKLWEKGKCEQVAERLG